MHRWRMIDRRTDEMVAISSIDRPTIFTSTNHLKMIATTPLLLFFIWILSEHRTSSSTVYDKCFDRNERAYEKAEFFNGAESCFFIPINATESSNSPGEKTGFVFNKSMATQICRDHDGTLPKPKTDMKNEFLAKFAGAGLIALAIEADNYNQRKWDFDDDSFIYHIPKRLTQKINRKNNTEYFGVFEQRSPSDETSYEWKLIESGTILSDRVRVVCEQPFAPSSIPVDNCLTPKKQGFRATKIHKRWGEHVCHFVINGATAGANRKTGSDGDRMFVFDPNYARSICYAHGGILPVIRTQKDQESLIASQKECCHKDETGGRIALALRRDWDSSTDLIWDDSTEVHFNATMKRVPVDVRNSTSFVLMADNTWMEVIDGEAVKYMTAVICQQAHELVLAQVEVDPKAHLEKTTTKASSGGGGMKKVGLSLLAMMIMIMIEK